MLADNLEDAYHLSTFNLPSSLAPSFPLPDSFIAASILPITKESLFPSLSPQV
jgi:hypothetical protein